MKKARALRTIRLLFCFLLSVLITSSVLPFPKAYSAPGMSRFFVYFPLYLKTGIYLMPVEYMVPYTTSLARQAIEALIQGLPDWLVKSSGMMTVSLPREAKVQSISIKDKLCTVDFSRDIKKISVGSGGEAALVNAIIATLCQFETVHSVKILIDGKTSESLAGHVDISQPLKEYQVQSMVFQTFPDAAQHWAGGAISAVQVSDIVDGYPDGTFKPDRSLTRAEFLKMLVETLKLPYATEGDQAVLPFKDVGNHWCLPYLIRALSSKIITPQDYDDTFKPDEPISREEAAYLLLKGSDVYLANHPELTLPGQGETLKFKDANQIQERYASSVQECVRRGFINGYPDGTFKPEGTLTRGEACTILARMQGIQGKDILLLGPKPGFKWDGSRLFVTGFATAFEANVNWRIKFQDGGDFMGENYTHTSNGMGWGSFGLCIDSAFLNAEESLVLQIYLRNMRDGGEYSLVQVPLAK